MPGMNDHFTGRVFDWAIIVSCDRWYLRIEPEIVSASGAA
jgi:hypothetical protein